MRETGRVNPNRLVIPRRLGPIVIAALALLSAAHLPAPAAKWQPVWKAYAIRYASIPVLLGLISSVRGSSQSGGYHKRRSGDQRRLTRSHTPRLFRLSCAKRREWSL